MVFYLCSIVTLSPRRTVFDIFELRNDMTLKTGLGSTRTHWGSYSAPPDPLAVMGEGREGQEGGREGEKGEGK